jgi:hypothetical protein
MAHRDGGMRGCPAASSAGALQADMPLNVQPQHACLKHECRHLQEQNKLPGREAL